MKKVLIINTLGLGLEGISWVIYNYASHMDLTNLTLTFLSPGKTDSDIVKMFSEFGDVVTCPSRKSQAKDYFHFLNSFIKNNHFDIVHIHGNSNTMGLDAFIAKKNKIHFVITHCHNDKTNHPILNYLLKPLLNINTDCKLACSKEAGKWLYRSRFFVLNNAIDIPKYEFNESLRSKIRKEYNIPDDVVILGHSGRFSEQKNHKFLIELFNDFHNKEPNSKLFLLSDGPLRESIKDRVHLLNLDDSVVFVGRVNNANDYYSAFDLFIFPSLWEGLGMVLVEAQTNQLPVISSNVVPHEVKINENVKFISLSQGNEFWIKNINELLGKRITKEIAIKNVREHGYDIELEADKLTNLYCFEVFK